MNKEEINEGVLILQLLKVDDNWSKLKYKEGCSWIAVKEEAHLINMKLKADQFDNINFNYIEELRVKAQNYDLINEEMQTKEIKLQHLSDSVYNYSTNVGDWEISEELQAFADSLMDLSLILKEIFNWREYLIGTIKFKKGRNVMSSIIIKTIYY